MILSSWEAIRKSGVPQVGGKAWNLAQLAHCGFTVPDGMAIGAEGYRNWLTASGLEKELLATVQRPGMTPESLSAITQRLADTPTGLDLSSMPDGPLAVRSSAPQEDTADASFAGIHAS